MNFTDLNAWQKSMDLVEEIYRITKNFPQSERFGLTSQLQRAATSIVANIAEGFGRLTSADKAHKYIISRGECSEVHAILLIAIRIRILTKENASVPVQLCNDVGRLLTGLIRSHTKNPYS